MHRAAAVLATAIAAAGATQALAQPLSKLPEEREAIMAALEQRGVGRVGRVLISARTATFACGLPQEEVVQVEGCSGMRHREETPEQVLERLRKRFGVGEALLADLRAKAQAPVEVDKPFDFLNNQLIWAPGSDVARRHLATPDLAVAFSRPAFDERRSRAVVYVATLSWRDPRRSFGEYVLLNKVRGKWSVAKHMRVWQLSPA